MNTSFSATLSWLRWLAACAVVLYHVRFLLYASYGHVRDKGPLVQLYYFVTGLGQEGFVLYIVASGMLLGGQSLRRWIQRGEDAWRDVAHKALWFYAFLVPALLLGGLFDLAGSCVFKFTGVYGYFDIFSPDLSLKAVTANLLPVQRFMVPGLGSNAMLFLLAYECWAYFALAAFVLLGMRWSGVLAGTAIAIEGAVLSPAFFGYLLLWTIAAAVFHHRDRLAIRPSLPVGCFIFAASLLASRIFGAHLPAASPDIALVVRSLLDLQFGAGCIALLLAMERPAAMKRGAWSLLVWRLNRRFPSAASVLLASHFPFMMLVVAVTSHSLAVPIAGQPRPYLFTLFCAVVLMIYAYAWVLSRLALRLVRMVPRARRIAGSLATEN